MCVYILDRFAREMSVRGSRFPQSRLPITTYLLPPTSRVSVERHGLPLNPVSVSFRPQTLLWLSRLLSCYPRSPATCILLVSRPDLFSAAVRTAETDRSPPLLHSFHTLLSNHILSGCRFVVLRSRRMLCICTLPLVYPFCYRVHPGSLTKVINSFSGT